MKMTLSRLEQCKPSKHLDCSLHNTGIATLAIQTSIDSSINLAVHRLEVSLHKLQVQHTFGLDRSCGESASGADVSRSPPGKLLTCITHTNIDLALLFARFDVL